MAIFGALSAAFLLMQDRLPSLIDFLVVLAALVNAGGWAWEWYQTFVRFDDFVHAFTSFAVVSAITWIAWSPFSLSTGVVLIRRGYCTCSRSSSEPS